MSVFIQSYLTTQQQEAYDMTVKMFGQPDTRRGYYYIHHPEHSNIWLSLVTTTGLKIILIFENRDEVRRVARKLNADYWSSAYHPGRPYVNGTAIMEDSTHLTNCNEVELIRVDHKIKMFPKIWVDPDTGSYTLARYAFTGCCHLCGGRRRIHHRYGGGYQEGLSNWPEYAGWLMTCNPCGVTHYVSRWQVEDLVVQTRRELDEKYGQHRPRRKNLKW